MGHINSSWGSEEGSYRRSQLLLSDQSDRDEIRHLISDYAAEGGAGELEAECYALSRHPRFDEFPEETRRIVNHIIYGEDL